MFLQGGENSEFWKSFEVFGLKEDNFLDYLESDKFYELLKRNRMSILIKTRIIFFSIILIVRRVFMTFLLLIKTGTKIARDGMDYSTYVSEYLMVIKSVNDNKYDMLTNKNSKFLFYNFNDYLNDFPVQYVRHIIISEDTCGLLDLQKIRMALFYRKVH